MFHLSPTRIVVDRQLKLPLESKLVRSAADVPLLVVCEADYADRDKVQRLEDAGAEVLVADGLAGLLQALATRGISSVLLEGGAKMASAFLEGGLVDRIYLFQSDVVVGGQGIAAPLTPSTVPSGFRLVAETQVGADRLVEYEKED